MNIYFLKLANGQMKSNLNYFKTKDNMQNLASIVSTHLNKKNKYFKIKEKKV